MSSSFPVRLASLLVFAAAAMSQTSNSSADAPSEMVDNRLCNSSISAANASGIFISESDHYNAGGVPDHSWAITISGGNGQRIQREFWYDTAGQNYADDVGMDTDVCALPNFNLPLNAHRLGQNDSGNCSTVFSQRCIKAVTSMASESALKWTTYSSPPPYENLTAGVLPSICRYIGNDLQDTIEKECGAQMRADDGTTANFQNPLALTGYNSSYLYDSNCTLSAGDRTLYQAGFSYPVLSQEWAAGSDEGYDNITNALTPILTVYLPVANMQRTGCCNSPRTVLECIRASNASEGSRVAPALAAGTPWPTPGALTAGAKGGIAGGVVGFALVAGGGALYFWIARRKKRARAAVAAAQEDAKAGDGDRKMLPTEADAGVGVFELTDKDRKQELDGFVVSEIGGGERKASELANTAAPVELPAGNCRRE